MTSKAQWRKALAAAQEDEGFQAWLAMMDYQVEDFLTFDLPAVPDDPFTAEGLRVAEQAVLEAFPDREAVASEEGGVLFDRYSRYLGECFVRKLGGTWVNVPPEDADDTGYLGVQLPTTDIPLRIDGLVLAAITRRTGRVWAPVFQYAEEDAQKGVHRTGLPR